jgi:hypothetical protein
MQMKNYFNLKKSKLLLLTLLTMLVVGARPAWAQKSMPYSYGFEDNNLATDGWTTQNPSGRNNHEFGINSYARKTGSYGFRFSSLVENGENTQYFISPELNASREIELTFEYRGSDTRASEKFKVGYSTTNTDIASFTFDGDEYSANDDSWATFRGNFPAGTKYIAVYYYSEAKYQLYVDDFSFKLACPAPTNLTATNVTPTSATLNWEGNAESYNVRYRKLVFFDDFENGLGNWTTYTMGDAAAWGTEDPSILRWSGHNSSTNVAFSMSWNDNVSYHADNWLVTPQVQLGGTLKFYVYTNQGFPDAYEVKLSTGGNTISDFTVTLQELASIPTTGDWVEVNIDLSSYEGQSGYIAIHHSHYDGNYILVDDFSIYPPQEAGEWIEATSTTNSFDITGLTPGTTCEFQVQGVYGEDGESNWSASATFTTNSEMELVNDDSENEAGKKNADYIAAAENKSCDVTLSGRTLYKDGQWNTLCLPFSVTLAGSPLEGATARTLTAAEVTGSGDDTHISLTFGDPVEQLAAGVPYIIKWANDGSDNIENPEFTGVTISSTEGQTLSFLEGQVQFKGNYSAFTVGDNANIYYMAASEDATHEGILRKAASTRTMLACRAYFQFSGADAARSVILNFGEGEASGIVDQRSENTTADGSWYTVDGVKLDKQPARKGLYIQGGRKVVVK